MQRYKKRFIICILPVKQSSTGQYKHLYNSALPPPIKTPQNQLNTPTSHRMIYKRLVHPTILAALFATFGRVFYTRHSLHPPS